MKSNKFTLKKNAQAMVEFALVLPILLLLVYGILETGRLLFIYSTIVTASRQAVRYAATTGMGGNYIALGGPDNRAVPRYLDCFGIRLSAQKVDFLNSFENDDVFVWWDTGPSTTQHSYCASGTNAELPATVPITGNTSRVIVRIRGDFMPIVRLIPFAERTQANGRPIQATSARTVLISVPIPVAAAAAEPTTMTLVASPPSTSTSPTPLGTEVTFTATVTDGATTPTGGVTFSVDGVPIAGCDPVGLDTAGVAICKITFNSPSIPPDSFDITADYDPQGANFQAQSITMPYWVGEATTNVVLTGPGWSFPNQDVVYHVTVTSAFGVPSGQVLVVSNGGSCTVDLNPATGEGDCTLNFATLGLNFPIDANYTGDSQHLASIAPTKYHDVLSVAATVTFTPIPPTPTFTPIPPTAAATSTFTPTMVPNCNVIRDSVGTLIVKFVDVPSPAKDYGVMYLDIPNATGAPITIESVRVGWNYANGHRGSDQTLTLNNATLNGTSFWIGSESLPIYQVPLPASPLIIPPGGTSQIAFIFNQTYDRVEAGLQSLYITFSTPGCTTYPIDVTIAVEE